MTARRVLAMVISAVGTLGVFAFLLANQWVDEWILDRDPSPGFGDLVLRWMRFPSWRIGDDQGSFSYQAIFDVGLVIFLGLLALFVFLGARGIDAERGTVGAFILGWWATAVAGAVAGLVRNLMWIATDEMRGGDLVAFGLSSGATFGIAFGWLMGLATMIAFSVTRAKTPVGAQPGLPQPPPPAPAGMLPRQHPASAPYVPPGQQAGWTPPPSSPGAGPSGGYPTPPLPAAPPPPQPHPQARPPAPAATPPPVPAPQPEPAPVDVSDAVAMAEPAQSAAPESMAQPPAPPQPAPPEPEMPEPEMPEPAASEAAQPEAAPPGPAVPEDVVARPAAPETLVEQPVAQEPEAAASEGVDDVVPGSAEEARTDDDEDDRPLPPPS